MYIYVRMRQNTEQHNSKYGHFVRIVTQCFIVWMQFLGGSAI